jgi:hypothetical protein
MDHETLVYNADHGTTLDTILDVNRVGRNGHQIVAGTMLEMVYRIFDVGYGWTIIGHSDRRETFTDGKFVWRTKAVMWPSIVAVLFRESQLMAHCVRDFETIRVKTGGTRGIIRDGKKIRVPKTKSVSRPIGLLYMVPVNVDECKGPMRETKCRYMEYLPKTLRLSRYDGWEDFERTYLEAVEEAQTNPIDTDPPGEPSQPRGPERIESVPEPE